MGLLGGLLEGLGGLLGRLGPSWAVLGRHASIFVVLSSTRWAGARNLCRFGSPKRSQKGTQNASKSKTKSKTKTSRSRRPSWNDLRAILGRSWATPISKIVLSPRAGIVFSKLTILKKIRLQEASWAEVKPKWSPRGSQNGAQMQPKSVPRRSKRREEK